MVFDEVDMRSSRRLENPARSGKVRWRQASTAALPAPGGLGPKRNEPRSGVEYSSGDVTSHPERVLPTVNVGEPDPELIALPPPPKAERTATLVLMVVTTVAALALAWSLRGEARYAATGGAPAEVGDLARLVPNDALRNRYVRGSGSLGTTGAIRYGRAAEGDSFRLAPIAGNDNVWVEIRVPEGFEGPRFIPPSTFAGRLVPMSDAGLREWSLRSDVEEKTGARVPEGAWLLIDSTSPRASRWALLMTGLLLGFAAWNAVGILRLVGRVRDGRTPRGPAESVG